MYSREYIQKFFDTVNRLSEMNVDINVDFSYVMLLHSLPPSFGDFRCAIESRDVLPFDVHRKKSSHKNDQRK